MSRCSKNPAHSAILWHRSVLQPLHISPFTHWFYSERQRYSALSLEDRCANQQKIVRGDASRPIFCNIRVFIITRKHEKNNNQEICTQSKQLKQRRVSGRSVNSVMFSYPQFRSPEHQTEEKHKGSVDLGSPVFLNLAWAFVTPHLSAASLSLWQHWCDGNNAPKTAPRLTSRDLHESSNMQAFRGIKFHKMEKCLN